MNKVLILFCALSSISAFAQSTGEQVFAKIRNHLGYGRHAGRFLSRCEVRIAPTESLDELIISMEKPKLVTNESIASIYIKKSDQFTGSTRYPKGPYETSDVLSVGYREKAPLGYFDKAVIIESKGKNHVAVTIETYENGKIKSDTCVVEEDAR